MKLKQVLVMVIMIAAAFGIGIVVSHAQSGDAQQDELKPEDKLVVLWASGDREVALSMVFMYINASPRTGWWDDITLIVWGPSAKLLCEDAELQEYIDRMSENGITIKACRACANMYGVTEKLESFGLPVKYMGEELTSYIKEGRHILTF